MSRRLVVLNLSTNTNEDFLIGPRETTSKLRLPPGEMIEYNPGNDKVVDILAIATLNKSLPAFDYNEPNLPEELGQIVMDKLLGE